VTVKEVCSELEELDELDELLEDEEELLLVDEEVLPELEEGEVLLDDELEEAEALVEVCPLLLVVLDDVETCLVHPETLIPSSARTAIT
jgi:hypothetical protein